MLFAKGFYRNSMLDSRDEMFGRCSHIEEFIGIKLESLAREYRIIWRFRVECPPAGIGGNSTDYYSLTNVSKNALRMVSRKMFPAVWL